jgi:hypothetical protein
MSILLSLCLLLSLQSQAKVTTQLFGFNEKYRLAKPAAKFEADLAMAKGEFENFVVVLPDIKIKDLITDVKLTWKEKNPGVDLKTYQLYGHNFKSSSFKPRFKAGEIADIPVLLEDLQNRSIKPPSFSELSQSQYLFELYSTTNATPGIYKADLSFTVKKEKITLPVQIKIYDLVLPSKFELKTSFGFAPWQVLQKHYGSWHKDEQKLYDQYYKLALEHRIDLHKIYLKFPEKEAKDPLVDAPKGHQSFKQQTASLYAGENHQNHFQMAVTDLPIPEEYKNLKVESPKILKDIESFWKNLNASVIKNNFKDKTFVYYVDEPKEKDLKALGDDLRQIKKWAPDIKFLVTTPYRPSLEGAVDIWVLNLVLWERPTEKSAEFYKQRQIQKKEELWFYVGCNSHGCSEADDIMNPDFSTDRPSAYLRVFPWMALRYGATGVLYYDTVYTYNHGSASSPWIDSFDFTGYGEGGLFYPCTVKLGGCKTPHVIPSLRLKILRDGLEDVQIVSQALAKGFELKEVNKVVRHSRDFSLDTVDYEMVKRKALDFLTKPFETKK